MHLRQEEVFVFGQERQGRLHSTHYLSALRLNEGLQEVQAV